MKEMICIVCPKGCHLTVDEDNGYKVTGNACSRGADYGKNELMNPLRTLTSTVRIKGATRPRLSVKTNRSIRKGDIFAVMKVLNALEVAAPVKIGDVLLENAAGSGADIVATTNMPTVK